MIVTRLSCRAGKRAPIGQAANALGNEETCPIKNARGDRSLHLDAREIRPVNLTLPNYVTTVVTFTSV